MATESPFLIFFVCLFWVCWSIMSQSHYVSKVLHFHRVTFPHFHPMMENRGHVGLHFLLVWTTLECTKWFCLICFGGLVMVSPFFASCSWGCRQAKNQALDAELALPSGTWSVRLGWWFQSWFKRQWLGVSIVMGDPQNGWFIMENPHLKWMITSRYPHFRKPSKWDENPWRLRMFFSGGWLKHLSQIWWHIWMRRSESLATSHPGALIGGAILKGITCGYGLKLDAATLIRIHRF